MMSNREEAEDALQNAFVDVFAKLKTFRFESSVGAWIKRIVVNTCINALKKKSIVFLDIQENHPTEITPAYLPHQDKSVEVARIKSAIKKLPNGYRSVFTLYLMEGYDHKEISEILDISVSASKSQYSRAKQRLCQILADKKKTG